MNPTPNSREGPAPPSSPYSPNRLDRLLGESPVAWALLALLLLLPVLAAAALLGLAAGRLDSDPALLRGVGTSLLAAALTLSLVVAWLLRGLRRQLSRLRALAVCDPLTGVANRQVFLQALARQLDLGRRHGFPVSVVLLDLDHLERINQQHGYAVGDQVIAMVAQRLSEHLRDSDLLARTGGGELAVLVSHLGPDQALAAARRFRTVLTWQPLALGALELPVTASSGIATFAGEVDLDVEGLMSRAEAATRQAKGLGSDSIAAWEA
jgi:two-component system, sensor histidine kinase LadS